MLTRLIAVVSMGMFLSAQAPSAFSQRAAQNAALPEPPAQAAPVPAPASSTASSIVTVPAGTAIPLTLINPIRSKSSKPGDAVRATVAFPVTVGTVVAIPAGSYVEGALDQVILHSSAGQPQVKIHFTRLLFANGYSVSLDGENTQAELDAPDVPAEGTPLTATADVPLRTNAAMQPHLVRAAYGQQQPTLPPLPQVGPSPAVVMGAVLGGGAAVTIGALLWAHHHAANLDYVLFDAGWQFQMVLQQPAIIDTARLATPVAVPAGF